MYPKLKYLYFLPVSVAGLLSSCASEVLDSEDVDKGTVLTFTTTYQPTRAITTSIDEFVVYGDKKFNVGGNNNLMPVFDKTLVSFNGGKWTYNGVQYWYPNHEHSFVAVSPVSIVDPAASPRYSNSGLSFTYTVPTIGGNLVNKNDINDIFVATHRRLYIDTVKSGSDVTLKFQHILSLVNIALALNDSLMKKDEFVLIDKLEMSEIRSKADFTILPDAIVTDDQTDNSVVEVTGHAGDIKLTIEFAEAKKLVNDGKHVSLFDPGDAIIMLPQTFAADSNSKIVFSYTVNGDTDAQKRISLSLKDLKWEWGKSYIYQGTFAIDKTQVQLETMGITPWIPTQGPDSNAESAD